jgi:hypothetical protein
MALRWIHVAGALMLMLMLSSHARAQAGAGAPAAPGAIAGIVDGRAEFRTVFCALMRRDGADCGDWLRRFPDEAAPGAGSPPPLLVPDDPPAVNVVIVGGLFSECLPAGFTFGDASARLRAGGYRISYAPVLGRTSAEANAAIVRAHVARERAAMPHTPLVIVAYSKGVTDTMTALAAYPELADSVGAVIGVAGVVGGSHAADDLLRLYDATARLLPRVSSLKRCPAGDGGEVSSLTHDVRRHWLATHRLPAGPLYFSIVALPAPRRVSTVFAPFRRRLARFDARNDGQMIYADAILPGSRLLAYANADHFAVALPFDSPMHSSIHSATPSAMPSARLFGINHNDFPRAELVEAALRIAQAQLQRAGQRPGN